MTMQDILGIFVGIVVLKSLVIGSEFSFIKWYRYGKEYTTWYFNRPEFIPKGKG